MSYRFVVRTGSDLGRAIREARNTASLTQEQLSKSVGIDRSYLVRMENGISVLLLDRCIRVLRHLGAEIYVEVPRKTAA